jgi:hypothetical protein
VKVTVFEELLEWSQDRPAWQRDALRRLMLNGELSDDDIRALTDICKCAHGLPEQQEIAPLTKEHVPDKTSSSVPVSLVSIFHHRGVNALAEDQTLRFAPNLTVVYGDNAAGKDGIYPHPQERVPRSRAGADPGECRLWHNAAVPRRVNQIQGRNRT